MPVHCDFLDNPCADVIIARVEVTDCHTENSFLSDVLLDALRQTQVYPTVDLKPLLELKVDFSLGNHLCVQPFNLALDLDQLCQLSRVVLL